MHSPSTILPEWCAMRGLGLALLGLTFMLTTPLDRDMGYRAAPTLIGLGLSGLGAFLRAFGILTGLLSENVRSRPLAIHFRAFSRVVSQFELPSLAQGCNRTLFRLMLCRNLGCIM